MGEELKELGEAPVVGESGQVESPDVQPDGAGPVAGEGGAELPKGSRAVGGGEGEGSGLTPELEALVEARMQALREEYEGKDGHLARLKSAKDREIAQVRARLAERDEQDLQEAMQLAESDPRRAAQMMAQQNQQLMQRQQRERAVAELSQWAERVASDLGVDLDTDEEAAKALGVLLEHGPDYTHEFQQAMGRRAGVQRDEAMKALQKMEESLAARIDRALEAKLAEAGVGKVEGGSPRTPAGRNAIKNETDPGRLLADAFKDVREGTG